MEDEADVVGQGADATAEGGGPSGPPQGGPPQGGGPIMAALARQRSRPPLSAPGPGDQAQSMTMLMQAVSLIQQALPGLPPGSKMHSDALNAAQRLSRHANQGQPTAGVQQTHLQDLMRNLTRNALLQRIMMNMGQGQGNQNPGATPMQAAASPPMPSLPLPGA